MALLYEDKWKEGPPETLKEKEVSHCHHGAGTCEAVLAMARRETKTSFDIVPKRKKHILVSYEVVEADLQNC